MPQTDHTTMLATERIIKKFYPEYDPLTDNYGMDFYAEDILYSYGWEFDGGLMLPKDWQLMSEVETTLSKYLIEEWDFWWK